MKTLTWLAVTLTPTILAAAAIWAWARPPRPAPTPRRPRLAQDWAQVVAGREKAAAELAAGTATPIYDRLLIEQALAVLADDERIWQELGAS